MTIESRLAEIRARVENATPGPWEDVVDDLNNDVDVWHDGESRLWVANTGEVFTASAQRAKQILADAEFIAHARTDVPWLLGQVELRDKALEAVMALHKRLTFPDDGIGEPTACGHCDNETWPCTTITALTAPLEVEG